MHSQNKFSLQNLKKHKKIALQPIRGSLPLLKAQQKINKGINFQDRTIASKITLEGIHQSAKKNYANKLYKSDMIETLRKSEKLEQQTDKEKMNQKIKPQDKQLLSKKTLELTDLKQEKIKKSKRLSFEKNAVELEQSLEKYRQIRKNHSTSNLNYVQSQLKKFQMHKNSVTKSIRRSYITNSSNYNQRVIKKAIQIEKQLEKNRKIKQNASSAAFVYKQLSKHLVNGYSVSSEMGSMTNNNYCRVCIAPNLVRRQNKDKNISFFGLYEGIGSASKAEYMRQNFHHILSTDEFIYYNFYKALTRSLDNLDKDIQYSQRFSQQYSTVDFIICMLIGTKIYIIRSGSTNCSFCSQMGSYVRSLQQKKKRYHPLNAGSHKHEYNKGKKVAFDKILKLNKQTKFSNTEVDVHEISYHSNIDFILLGSEGLFQNISDPARIFWKNMLNNSNTTTQANCYEKLGQATAKLCSESVADDYLGRSMTVIAIAFQGLKKCFIQQIALRQQFEQQIISQNIGIEIPYINMEYPQKGNKQFLND